MNGEPEGVRITPSFRRFVAGLVAAVDNEEQLDAVITAASSEDREAFLAWRRRRVWVETEIIAAEERIRENEQRLQELDAELAEAEQ